MTYDLIIIGGGPGGYSAAIRGAQLGLKVALVEKDPNLGGTCLHRGCIPSKAYLAAAEMVEIARRAEKVGISFGRPQIDFKRLVASKDEKLKKLSQGLGGLVEGNKIDRISGEATFKSAKQVEVGSQVIEGRFIILATGTQPVRLPVYPFDGKTILTTDELFQMTELPKTMLIVGAGVSGCEMACAFNLLGVEVTLIELKPEIVSTEDRSVGKALRNVLTKRGVIVQTEISGKKVEKSGSDWSVEFSDGSKKSFEKILVATSRKVSDESKERLGLAAVGIELEAGFVKVNDRMETSVKGIYAVGDITGKTMLAHGAMEEGICAVENISGEAKKIDYRAVPRVIYTIPEIASIGSREEDLKKENTPYRAGRFSYLANGKALCHEEEEGSAQIFVGTEGESKGKILGATIFGAHAADLIQEVALVITNNLPIDALIRTVHAHPSLSEVIHEAAADSQGLAIHKLGRKPS